MTELLPLASYTGSGSGASVDLGVFRALRGTVDVSGFSGVSPATVALETSSDGASWRNVGTWQSITEEGQLERVFAGLSRYVRATYACGASTAEISIQAELVQVYATLANFASSGLRTGALEGVSNEEILSALEGASRLIDDYLAARTTLPLIVFANASLRRATVIVAVYDLLSVIGYSPEGDNDNFRQRYLDIIKWLEDVRSGEAPLPAGIEDSTTASEGVAEVESDEARGW